MFSGPNWSLIVPLLISGIAATVALCHCLCWQRPVDIGRQTWMGLTVRGQEGKKGHTVALIAFAFLAESLHMDRGKGGHRWGDSSPRWSGDWTGFKMLRSERYLRSCQVRPVRTSLWNSQMAPEAFFYISDNTSEYIMLPTSSREEEVIEPSTKCVLEQRHLRLPNTWTCLSSRAKLCCFSHSYCRERQEKWVCCWPRCPTFMPLRCSSDPALTEANRRLVTDPEARPYCIRA